ncbi:hypothetical protein PENTCL1PPCAC_29427, partial [Pristionchus entomophagus]
GVDLWPRCIRRPSLVFHCERHILRLSHIWSDQRIRHPTLEANPRHAATVSDHANHSDLASHRCSRSPYWHLGVHSHHRLLYGSSHALRHVLRVVRALDAGRGLHVVCNEHEVGYTHDEFTISQ